MDLGLADRAFLVTAASSGLGRATAQQLVAEGARVVVLCDHGDSSVLAAASLVAIGVEAADIAGGFAAWRAAGLPVARADDAPLAPGELAGMRPPAPPA